MDLEIFRDPIWAFIGVIVGAVITIIIFCLQKSKKGVSYQILSMTSLLTVKEKLEGKIKVFYNEQEVQNVKFFQIKILNSGNTCIPSSDYERPLKFFLDNNTKSKVLSAEIIESEPKSLITSLNVSENEIIIQPVLMNRKDFIIIKIILSDVQKSLDDLFLVDGRIKDVKNIKKKNETNSFKKEFFWFFLYVIPLSLLIMLSFKLQFEAKLYYYILGILIFFFSIIWKILKYIFY